MSSIQTQIDRISGNITAALNALKDRGAAVPDGANSDDLPALVQAFKVGVDTSDATATAADILSGKTAYADGEKVTGSIASKAAAAYTPGTADQTIAAGQYLSGVQTIKGDANLVAENIAEGVNIFGVLGTLAAGGELKSASGTATSVRKSWSGSTSTWVEAIDVSGLDFQPIAVFFYNYNSAYGTYNGAILFDPDTFAVKYHVFASSSTAYWQALNTYMREENPVTNGFTAAISRTSSTITPRSVDWFAVGV